MKLAILSKKPLGIAILSQESKVPKTLDFSCLQLVWVRGVGESESEAPRGKSAKQEVAAEEDDEEEDDDDESAPAPRVRGGVARKQEEEERRREEEAQREREEQMVQRFQVRLTSTLLLDRSPLLACRSDAGCWSRRRGLRMRRRHG